MITVQPIRFTSHEAEWHRLAQALGLTPAFPPGPGWSEFDGDGILAIHHAEPGSDLDGHSDFSLLTDDVDALEATLAASGFAVSRRLTDDIGPIVTVTAASGGSVTFSGGARQTDGGPLSVLPLWYQSDLAEPRAILAGLGLQPVLASDSGTWVEFAAAGGGRAALHRDESVRFELAFHYVGDLDALAAQLDEAGFPSEIVDEAYNRTLLVASPDGDKLWINGAQDDLYGYTTL